MNDNNLDGYQMLLMKKLKSTLPHNLSLADDLADLLEKRVLRKVGRTGRSAHYAIWSDSDKPDKPDINPT